MDGYHAIDHALFAVRVVYCDYYLGSPLDKDSSRDDLPVAVATRDRDYSQRPIIRVFGATPAGQKCCVHVHGVLPYFYVHVPNPRQLLEHPSTFLSTLQSELESTLQPPQLAPGRRAQRIVRSLTACRGIPFFGFHYAGTSGDPSIGAPDRGAGHVFIKVSLLNPMMVKRAADALQTGTIPSGRAFQPYETHISYLLQFFMDYSISGMAFLCAGDVRFRSPLPLRKDLTPDLGPVALRRLRAPQELRYEGASGGGSVSAAAAGVVGGALRRVWLASSTPSALCHLAPPSLTDSLPAAAASSASMSVVAPRAPGAAAISSSSSYAPAAVTACSSFASSRVVVTSNAPVTSLAEFCAANAKAAAIVAETLVGVQLDDLFSPTSSQAGAAPRAPAAPPPRPMGTTAPPADRQGVPRPPPQPPKPQPPAAPAPAPAPQAPPWVSLQRHGIRRPDDAFGVRFGLLRNGAATVSKCSTCALEADVWAGDILNVVERESLRARAAAAAAATSRARAEGRAPPFVPPEVAFSSVPSLSALWLEEEARRRAAGGGGGGSSQLGVRAQLSASQSSSAGRGKKTQDDSIVEVEEGAPDASIVMMGEDELPGAAAPQLPPLGNIEETSLTDLDLTWERRLAKLAQADRETVAREDADPSERASAMSWRQLIALLPCVSAPVLAAKGEAPTATIVPRSGIAAPPPPTSKVPGPIAPALQSSLGPSPSYVASSGEEDANLLLRLLDGSGGGSSSSAAAAPDKAAACASSPSASLSVAEDAATAAAVCSESVALGRAHASTSAASDDLAPTLPVDAMEEDAAAADDGAPPDVSAPLRPADRLIDVGTRALGANAIIDDESVLLSDDGGGENNLDAQEVSSSGDSDDSLTEGGLSSDGDDDEGEGHGGDGDQHHPPVHSSARMVRHDDAKPLSSGTLSGMPPPSAPGSTARHHAVGTPTVGTLPRLLGSPLLPQLSQSSSSLRHRPLSASLARLQRRHTVSAQKDWGDIAASSQALDDGDGMPGEGAASNEPDAGGPVPRGAMYLRAALLRRGSFVGGMRSGGGYHAADFSDNTVPQEGAERAASRGPHHPAQKGTDASRPRAMFASAVPAAAPPPTASGLDLPAPVVTPLPLPVASGSATPSRAHSPMPSSAPDLGPPSTAAHAIGPLKLVPSSSSSTPLRSSTSSTPPRPKATVLAPLSASRSPGSLTPGSLTLLDSHGQRVAARATPPRPGLLMPEGRGAHAHTTPKAPTPSKGAGAGVLRRLQHPAATAPVAGGSAKGDADDDIQEDDAPSSPPLSAPVLNVRVSHSGSGSQHAVTAAAAPQPSAASVAHYRPAAAMLDDDAVSPTQEVTGDDDNGLTKAASDSETPAASAPPPRPLNRTSPSPQRRPASGWPSEGGLDHNTSLLSSQAPTPPSYPDATQPPPQASSSSPAPGSQAHSAAVTGNGALFRHEDEVPAVAQSARTAAAASSLLGEVPRPPASFVSSASGPVGAPSTTRALRRDLLVALTPTAAQDNAAQENAASAPMSPAATSALALQPANRRPPFASTAAAAAAWSSGLASAWGGGAAPAPPATQRPTGPPDPGAVAPLGPIHSPAAHPQAPSPSAPEDAGAAVVDMDDSTQPVQGDEDLEPATTGISSPPAGLFKLRCRPPSPLEVASTLTSVWGLPSVIHPEPRYCDDRDVPERPVNIAGLRFTLKGASLRWLQPFDTSASVALARQAVTAGGGGWAAAAAQGFSYLPRTVLRTNLAALTSSSAEKGRRMAAAGGAPQSHSRAAAAAPPPNEGGAAAAGEDAAAAAALERLTPPEGEDGHVVRSVLQCQGEDAAAAAAPQSGGPKRVAFVVDNEGRPSPRGPSPAFPGRGAARGSQDDEEGDEGMGMGSDEELEQGCRSRRAGRGGGRDEVDNVSRSEEIWVEGEEGEGGPGAAAGGSKAASAHSSRAPAAASQQTLHHASAAPAARGTLQFYADLARDVARPLGPRAVGGSPGPSTATGSHPEVIDLLTAPTSRAASQCEVITIASQAPSSQVPSQAGGGEGRDAGPEHAFIAEQVAALDDGGDEYLRNWDYRIGPSFASSSASGAAAAAASFASLFSRGGGRRGHGATGPAPNRMGGRDLGGGAGPPVTLLPRYRAQQPQFSDLTLRQQRVCRAAGHVTEQAGPLGPQLRCCRHVMRWARPFPSPAQAGRWAERHPRPSILGPEQGGNGPNSAAAAEREVGAGATTDLEPDPKTGALKVTRARRAGTSAAPGSQGAGSLVQPSFSSTPSAVTPSTLPHPRSQLTQAALLLQFMEARAKWGSGGGEEPGRRGKRAAPPVAAPAASGAISFRPQQQQHQQQGAAIAAAGAQRGGMDRGGGAVGDGDPGIGVVEQRPAKRPRPLDPVPSPGAPSGDGSASAPSPLAPSPPSSSAAVVAAPAAASPAVAAPPLPRGLAQESPPPSAPSPTASPPSAAPDFNNHLTVLAVELHARTRGILLPDPQFDPIVCIAYAVSHEDLVCARRAAAAARASGQAAAPSPTEFRDCVVTGVILVDPRAPGEGTPDPNSGPPATNGLAFDCGGAGRLASGVAPGDRTLVTRVPDEAALLWALVALVRDWDADVLVGFDLQMSSLGYALDRAGVLRLPLAQALSRVPAERNDPRNRADAWGERHDSGIWITGRILLNVWRLMRGELKLGVYTFESVVHSVLRVRVPLFTPATLTAWWDAERGGGGWGGLGGGLQSRVTSHLVTRCALTLHVLDALDLVGRTSETARLFGIDFFSVLSRGSQYRVEAVMLRAARPLGFLAPTPTRTDVARQAAMETIPLILEPASRVYSDPVVVLDFQSLYPSVVIAYNMCYSTALGRMKMHPQPPGSGAAAPASAGVGAQGILRPKLGFAAYAPPHGAIAEGYTAPWGGTAARRFERPPPCAGNAAASAVAAAAAAAAAAPGPDGGPGGVRRPPRPTSAYIAPNGVLFAPYTQRRGVLPRMLQEILDTRVMVKRAMGRPEVKADPVLSRVMHARQYALKMIANVTYGYTAAGFSGRMPCAEIADAIVETGRRTLERAIALVEGHPTWAARVVYGDTDSMFVLLAGRSPAEAFRIGEAIAAEVSARNPRPITLKMDKVYHPAFLVAKKRYAGFMYDSPPKPLLVKRRDGGDGAPAAGAEEGWTLPPSLDCKGLEFVRRDTCALVSKTMEAFMHVVAASRCDLSAVKALMLRTWTKIMEGRLPLSDYLFAKEVKLGSYSARGPLPPAAIVATKLMLGDPRAEPRYGERVRYVVVSGPPGARLVDLVATPLAVLTDPERYRLNVAYYIEKQVLPALERIASLMGADMRAWLADMHKPSRRRMRPLLLEGWGGVGGDRLGAPGRAAAAGGGLQFQGGAVAGGGGGGGACPGGGVGGGSSSGGGSGGGGGEEAVDVIELLSDTQQPNAQGDGELGAPAPETWAKVETGGPGAARGGREGEPARGAATATTASATASTAANATLGRGRRTIDAYYLSRDCEVCAAACKGVVCDACASDRQRLCYALTSRSAEAERQHASMLELCKSCTRISEPGPLGAEACESLDCPVFYERSRLGRLVQRTAAVLRAAGFGVD